MFIPDNLLILPAVIFLMIVGLLLLRRRLTWFGRLPGDVRYEGRRARVYAPLTSMLLLSLLFSLVVFLLSLIF